MKFKLITIISLLCVLSNTLSAQVQKAVYQTLNVSDSTEQINFNFPDSCEVISWRQDGKIMIETTVNMEINSKEVINTLAQDGRYAVAHKRRTT